MGRPPPQILGTVLQSKSPLMLVSSVVASLSKQEIVNLVAKLIMPASVVTYGELKLSTKEMVLISRQCVRS